MLNMTNYVIPASSIALIIIKIKEYGILKI